MATAGTLTFGAVNWICPKLNTPVVWVPLEVTLVTFEEYFMKVFSIEETDREPVIQLPEYQSCLALTCCSRKASY